MLWYRAAGPNGESTISARTIRRAAHKRRVLLLIYQRALLDAMVRIYMQSRSTWLRRSQFNGSGRWLDGPGGGIFHGPSGRARHTSRRSPWSPQPRQPGTSVSSSPRPLRIRGTFGRHSCSPSASGAPLAYSKGTRTRPAQTPASSLLQVSSILMLRSRTRRLLRTCRSQLWMSWALRFGRKRALGEVPPLLPRPWRGCSAGLRPLRPLHYGRYRKLLGRRAAASFRGRRGAQRNASN